MKRTHLFIQGEAGTLYSVLHNNDERTQSNQIIILCPPVGIDYMNSHRSLRHLADKLALTGTSVLRLDYIGTGNSSDNVGSEQVLLFLNSIRQSIRYLKETLGYKSVILLGIKFGATLASLIANEVELGGLILWSGYYKGSALIRELNLLQKTSSEEPPTNQTLEAGGWLIDKSTEISIRAIDLHEKNPKTKNILILANDESNKHHKLVDCWESPGKDIELKKTSDLSDILVDAHDTIIPNQSIRTICDWVNSQIPSTESSNRPQSPKIITSAKFPTIDTLNGDRINISESLRYTKKTTGHFSVSTTSDEIKAIERPLVLVLNSGSNHHVGPHRLNVSLCRQLSTVGFDCIRLDLPGLGESDCDQGELENVPYMKSPLTAIQRCLNEESTLPNSIIIIGLCSGAYHSFLSALQLESHSIVEVIIINPLTFYWEQGMKLEDAPSVEYRKWEWYRQTIKNSMNWKKLFSGKVKITPIIQSVLSRILTLLEVKLTSLKLFFKPKSSSAGISKYLAENIKKIIGKNTHLTFVFARNDPGINILLTQAGKIVKKMEKENKLHLEYIENSDHTFSKFSARKHLFNYISQHLSSRYIKSVPDYPHSSASELVGEYNTHLPIEKKVSTHGKKSGSISERH